MSIQVQINRVSDFTSNIIKAPTDYCELVFGGFEGYNDWFVEVEIEKLGDFLLALEDHEQCPIEFRKGDNTVEVTICDVL